MVVDYREYLPLGHKRLISINEASGMQATHQSGHQRVYFVHIRKTGGTSVNHMFLSQHGCDANAVYEAVGKSFTVNCNDHTFAGWNKQVIAAGNYDYAFSHHPLYTLQIPEQTFLFSCFRDPVSRVISLYNMLMTLNAENSDHPGMVHQRQWLGETFGDFLDRAPNTEIANQLFMFSPKLHVEEALLQTRRLSYFFFTSTFNAGIEHLNEVLGLELKASHLRKTDRTFEITPAEKLRLREMLADEYRFIEALKEAHQARFSLERFSLITEK